MVSSPTRLLVDHREDLVAERTRIICRLRWHLHELDPGWTPPARIERRSAFDKVAAHLSAQQDNSLVRRLALRLVDHLRLLDVELRLLTVEIDELTEEITTRVSQTAPSLLAIVGCGAPADDIDSQVEQYSGPLVWNVDGLGGHASLLGADRCAANDREDAAIGHAGRLRQDDERGRPLPHRADDALAAQTGEGSRALFELLGSARRELKMIQDMPGATSEITVPQQF